MWVSPDLVFLLCCVVDNNINVTSKKWTSSIIVLTPPPFFLSLTFQLSRGRLNVDVYFTAAAAKNTGCELRFMLKSTFPFLAEISKSHSNVKSEIASVGTVES